MKSPSQNSPLASMKKQRSASPSQAMPRSAPVALHPLHDHPPVLLQQRVGLVVGELAVGREVHLLQLERQLRRRIGPTIGPPIPLPPSTTTFIGLTLARIDEGEGVGAELLPDVDLLEGTAARGVAEAGLDLRPDVADPGVAGERQRPLADQLDAGVGLRIVGGGDHRAAVELAGADQVVEHLGRDHAGVEHRRPLEDHPVAQLGGHRRRGQPHVAPEPDPQLGRPACRAAAPAPGRRRGRSRARWSRPSPSRRGRGCRMP